MVSAIETPSLW